MCFDEEDIRQNVRGTQSYRKFSELAVSQSALSKAFAIAVHVSVVCDWARGGFLPFFTSRTSLSR